MYSKTPTVDECLDLNNLQEKLVFSSVMVFHSKSRQFVAGTEDWVSKLEGDYFNNGGQSLKDTLASKYALYPVQNTIYMLEMASACCCMGHISVKKITAGFDRASERKMSSMHSCGFSILRITQRTSRLSHSSFIF